MSHHLIEANKISFNYSSTEIIDGKSRRREQQSNDDSY